MISCPSKVFHAGLESPAMLPEFKSSDYLFYPNCAPVGAHHSAVAKYPGFHRKVTPWRVVTTLMER